MTLQDYVSLIKDIITSLAAIVAAVVAILGLQAWKKQLAGKTKYELAQRLLKATYKVRGALAEVRRWYTTEGETSQAVKEENEDVNNSDEFTRGLKTVYRNRWQKVQEALIELDTVSLEAEAIWDASIKENLQPLVNCVTTLSVAIDIYLDKIERKLPMSMFQETDDRDRKIIYTVPGEKDNFFSNEITEAVRKMENYLKPHLKI